MIKPETFPLKLPLNFIIIVVIIIFNYYHYYYYYYYYYYLFYYLFLLLLLNIGHALRLVRIFQKTRSTAQNRGPSDQCNIILNYLNTQASIH